MKLKHILATAGAVLALPLTATPANAQATRTWVSGVGDDVNPCSRTAPCKTFAGAISKTAAGGEINCLDPGGYGTLTVTKSITIDCRGTLGSTLNSGGINGFNINDSATGTPGTIIVTLRNIAINGAGTTLGLNGIRFISGARLTVENVTIQNQSGAGISIANGSGAAQVHVTNTTIGGSTAASEAGVRVQPTGAATASLTLNNVEMVGNFRGLDMITTGTTAGNTAILSGVTINVSTDNGINVQTNANAANVMIENSRITNNLRGIVLAGAGATARLGSSVVMGNGPATAVSGGATVLSYRNSQIDLNGNNTTPITQAPLN